MPSSANRSTSGRSSALIGGLLGGIVGLIGGVIFSGLALQPPPAEVNNLSFGALGLARTALVIVTVMFGTVLGITTGVIIGAFVGLRAKQAPAVAPPESGISFPSDQEPKS